MSDEVWVRTAPSASGKTYVVTVEFSDDHAMPLNRTEAREYAAEIFAAAAIARHDAAVYRQLLEKGIDETSAAAAVYYLRENRRPVGMSSSPLGLAPGVNERGEPFLALTIDGEPAGQWSPDAAEDHAAGVLGATAAADCDQAYFRYLCGTAGLEEQTARLVVADLAGRLFEERAS